MRTEDDLRDAYTFLARSAPTADDLRTELAPAPRLRPRSQWIAVTAAALTVTAVAVAVPSMTSRSSPSPAAPPKVETSARNTDPGVIVTTTSTVSVSSIQAMTADVPLMGSGGPTLTGAGADGTATTTFVADYVPVTAAGSVVRLPFKFGYLPDGVRVVSANADGAVGLADETGVQHGAPFTTAITVQLLPVSKPGGSACGPTSGTSNVPQYFRELPLGTYTGCAISSTPGGPVEWLHTYLDRGRVDIQFDAQHLGAFDNDELVNIVASMTVATSFEDHSTWFESILSE